MFDSLERQAARAARQGDAPPPSSLSGRYLSLDDAEERDDVAACLRFCARVLALASLTERCDGVVARLLREADAARNRSGVAPERASAPRVRVSRRGSVLIDGSAARPGREAEVASSSDDDEAWREAHRRAVAAALASEAVEVGGGGTPRRGGGGDARAARVHVTRRGSIDIPRSHDARLRSDSLTTAHLRRRTAERRRAVRPRATCLLVRQSPSWG